MYFDFGNLKIHYFILANLADKRYSATALTYNRANCYANRESLDPRLRGDDNSYYLKFVDAIFLAAPVQGEECLLKAC